MKEMRIVELLICVSFVALVIFPVAAIYYQSTILMIGTFCDFLVFLSLIDLFDELDQLYLMKENEEP